MNRSFYFAVSDKSDKRMLVYLFYLDREELNVFVNLLKSSKSIRMACVDAAINAEFMLPEKEIQKTGRPYAICSIDGETIEFYDI
jgi:hypothetical protein